MGEQLLLRRGAFEQGIQQHQEHADEVAEIEEERVSFLRSGDSARILGRIALIALLLALLLIVLSVLLTLLAH